MNFATWSIRNPIPSILLFILLTLAGLWGFRALPIQTFPDIDLPTVNVTLVQPGAAPAQLETEVARKVEDSLATLSGLKHLRTAITDGRVTVAVEFVLEKSSRTRSSKPRMPSTACARICPPISSNPPSAR